MSYITTVHLHLTAISALLTLPLAACMPPEGPHHDETSQQETEENTEVTTRSWIRLEARMRTLDRILQEGESSKMISASGAAGEELKEKGVIIQTGEGHRVELDKTEWSVRSGNLNWLDGPFEHFMRYNEVTWCATDENAWDFVTDYVDEFEDTYETQAEYLESIEDYVDCGDGHI